MAPLVKQLKIVSLEYLWALQVAEIVFRCNHGSAPSALKDKLRRNNHMELGQEVLKRAICHIVLLRCPESCLFQTVLP